MNVTANGTEGPSGDGIDLYTTTGRITITGSTANGNADPPRQGTSQRRADGFDIDTEGGDVELTDVTANGNANIGIHIATTSGHNFTPSGNVAVTGATANESLVSGVDVETGVEFGDGGTAAVSESMFDGNGKSGMVLSRIDGDATVNASSATGNGDDGFLIDEVMGNAVVRDSTANRNEGNGFWVSDSAAAFENMTATVEDSVALDNGKNGFRIDYQGIVGQNTLAQRLTATGNGVAGLDIESSGTVSVQEVTTRDNAGNGISLDGVAGDGVLITPKPLLSASVRDSLVMDNLGAGIELSNPTDGSDFVFVSNAICGNAPEIEVEGTANVVATGNLWATLDGPEAGEVVSGGGTVDTEPWIDTIAVQIVPELPFVVDEAATLALTLRDEAGTVEMGAGPGDPNGGGSVHWETDNGVLSAGANLGATVDAGVEEAVQLVPAEVGMATVGLQLPCATGALVTGEVVEGPLNGDTDCSGVLDMTDFRRTLEYAAGLAVTGTLGCPAADVLFDVDCDGTVTGTDALPLLLYAALLGAEPERCA